MDEEDQSVNKQLILIHKEYDKIQTVDNKKVEPTYKASKKTKNQNKKALP